MEIDQAYVKQLKSDIVQSDLGLKSLIQVRKLHFTMIELLVSAILALRFHPMEDFVKAQIIPFAFGLIPTIDIFRKFIITLGPWNP